MLTNTLVRIDEIPVRGLKQKIGMSLIKDNKVVRIDEIPVRGLKLVVHSSAPS